jgi:hypothetical protein
MVTDIMENDFQAGDVTGRFVVRDVKTYGLAKTNFLAVRPYFSGNTMNMEIDVEIPKALIDGNYKVEGSIGSYKVGGKGTSLHAYFYILRSRLDPDFFLLARNRGSLARRSRCTHGIDLNIRPING